MERILLRTQSKRSNRDNGETSRMQIGMGKGTRNLLAMLQFAELWNGTGCADFGRINPYLYAGTNIYSKGKYPYDGHWDPEWEDGQPGVLYLLTQVY